MARTKRAPIPSVEIMLTKYSSGPWRCGSCNLKLYKVAKEAHWRPTSGNQHEELQALCERERDNACCPRMKVLWVTLRGRVDVRPHRSEEKATQQAQPRLPRVARKTVEEGPVGEPRRSTRPLKPSKKLCSHEPPSETSGRMNGNVDREASMVPSGSTSRQPEEVLRPSRKRKRDSQEESDDAGEETTSAPSSKKRRTRAIRQGPEELEDETEAEQYVEETASGAAEDLGQRTSKAVGEDRKDTEAKGAAQKFGWRLYNYFNLLGGHSKIKATDLLAQDVFAAGRSILPDLIQGDATYTEESTLIHEMGFDADNEKRAIYRIAKYQAAIAAAIYCEHNLRVIQKKQQDREKLGALDLFNFNKAAIQYYLNRDATVFAKVFDKWQTLGFFPSMFLGSNKRAANQEMEDMFDPAERKRLYEAFIEWEDEKRPNDKILIRL